MIRATGAQGCQAVQVIGIYELQHSFVVRKMADHFCKKDLLFAGMLLQGLALVALLFADSMIHFVILSSLLGWGTAMVYPTFLATVAENTHPADRANSLGVFRFWRDSGYAIGAILTGIIADTLGINSSVLVIGLLSSIRVNA